MVILPHDDDDKIWVKLSLRIALKKLNVKYRINELRVIIIFKIVLRVTI